MSLTSLTAQLFATLRKTGARLSVCIAMTLPTTTPQAPQKRESTAPIMMMTMITRGNICPAMSPSRYPSGTFFPTVAELTSSKRRPDRAAPRGGKPLRDFAGLRGREPFGALTLASFAEIAASPRPRLLPSFLSFPIIRPPLLLSQAKLFTASRAPHTALAHLHLHDPDSSSGSQPTHHFLRC